jgi:predicted RNA-binding protein associated with RNAse of E/G family
MECILLKDDTVEYSSDDILITSWKTLNPKTEFSHGCSCYFFKEGFKISKFYKPNGQLLYYYCDIVEFDYDEKEQSLTVTDLLADVIIYPNGIHKVVDLEELADAQEQALISSAQLNRSLRQLDKLLNIIQKGDFPKLLTQMESLGL